MLGRRAARAAGWSAEEWERFRAEATSADYDRLLGPPRSPSPLTVHVDDWHAAKLARGVHAGTWTSSGARVLRVVRGVRRDLVVGKVESWLAEERAAGRMKQRASNHYLTALGDFCGWMVDDGRAAASRWRGSGA